MRVYEIGIALGWKSIDVMQEMKSLIGFAPKSASTKVELTFAESFIAFMKTR